MRTSVLLSVAAAGLIAVPASAGFVEVEITGVVEFNLINFGEFGNVNAGDDAKMTFLLDSDDFVDSGSFNTRGYVIDQSSFSLQLGGVEVGLQNPFPAGQDPFFVLRDNDPVADGFFLSTGTDFPNGVPLSETGQFGQFRDAFSVSYEGDTLNSLDLLDALGTYDFDGLTVFNWTLTDGPFDAMGMIFEQMTITEVPAPGALAFALPLAFARRRRRA
jgi:hypothetical protein